MYLYLLRFLWIDCFTLLVKIHQALQSYQSHCAIVSTASIVVFYVLMLCIIVIFSLLLAVSQTFSHSVN